ncbi:hypothetical protein M501DRAFT_1054654 [Patellaria atrata CBS 101060]|uniref:WKF domain-containing protein n=1 Tax=Patellaria atrata CBS 101060 TaxID=1346257 RepID=A0A9P4SHW3_9PEZI|nr:hypothetical protein M501DRAFT_1054654 [Patellaria atrata CBS 101060]
MTTYTPHVPAWKRLGLKLKNANEPSQASNGIAAASGKGNKKRPLENDYDRAAPGASLGKEKSSTATSDAPASRKSKVHVEEFHTPKKPSKRRKLSDEEDEAQTSRSNGDGVVGVNTPISCQLTEVRENHDEPSTNGKRSKKTKTPKGASTNPSNGDTVVNSSPSSKSISSKRDQGQNDSNQKQPQAIAEENPTEATPKRRKSVTFTADVKTEDGSRTQQLLDDWIKENLGEGRDQKNLTREEFWAYRESLKNDKSSEKETKKKKKPKKGESKEDTDAPSCSGKSPDKTNSQVDNKLTTTPIPPYLEYLQTYHTNRSAWKFHKVHQSQLLKHLFDISLIPHSHDPALKAYISGLRGESAKSRLRVTAQEVIDGASESTMDTPAARKAAHDDALRKHLKNAKKRRREQDAAAEQDSDADERVYKRQRAEMILQALGPVPHPVPAEQKSLQQHHQPHLEREQQVLPPSETFNGVVLTQPRRSAIAPTKISFGDDVAVGNGVRNGIGPGNGAPVKRKRSRKSRTLQSDSSDNDMSIPSPAESSDSESSDEESSSSGSSSGSGSSSSESDSDSSSESSDDKDDESTYPLKVPITTPVNPGWGDI